MIACVRNVAFVKIMPKRDREVSSAGNSKVTLWISSLPFEATKEDIAAHFATAAG